MRIGSLIAKGVATFEVGSAGSPSITFSGSTTAGFFAPSAGQVAIAAGAGVNVFELATTGKLTLTTGYDGLLPAAGVGGDDQAAVTKKWVEDNFVIGDITTLNLGDLADVSLTGLATNDFLVRSGSDWVNQTPATAQQTMGVEVGVDVQAWDTNLDQIAALTPTADNFIAGNAGGTAWELKTPAAARTSLGLVSGGAGDIWVEKAGDSMDSGANINFQGNGEVLGLPATPSAADAAASKAYVDSQSVGLSWVNPVYYIDFLGDGQGGSPTRDLQTPGNDTNAFMTSLEDSDMVVANTNGTWTAVGLTGTTTTTDVQAGDVLRFEYGDGSAPEFTLRGNIGASDIWSDDETAGHESASVRWGTQIDTGATPGGFLTGYTTPIVELVLGDESGHTLEVVLTTTSNGVTTDASDGGTGFTINVTQQGTAGLPEITQIIPNAASTLQSSGAADYITVYSAGDATQYYFWFDVDDGNTDPAPGGTGIEVDVTAADTSTVVADKLRRVAIHATGPDTDFTTNAEYDALWGVNEDNATLSQMDVTCGNGASVTAGDYFTYHSATGNNSLGFPPADNSSAHSGTKFYVWFEVDASTGNDPTPGGHVEGIKVDIASGDTAAQVATKVYTALDNHRPQQAGSEVGEPTLWVVTDLTGVVRIEEKHAGRVALPVTGAGLTPGWSYAENQQGAYNGTANSTAFFVSNTDSLNYGTQWVYTTTTDDWTLFGGQLAILPGIGLSQNGQFFDVNLGPGIYENPSDQVALELYNTSTGAIILTTDGTSREQNDVDSKLHLLLNGSTLTQGASGLNVAATGITETELNTSVAGAGLAGGGGSPLSVNGGDGITISVDDVVVDATSTFTFPAGQLEIDTGAVTDAMLATDYVEVAGDSMTGDLSMTSGSHILLDGSGTATDPDLAVVGDTNTGLYSVGTDQLGVSAGGTLRATFSTTDLTMTVPVILPDGAVSTPSLTFTGDLDTGLWHPTGNSNILNASTGGVLRFQIEADGTLNVGTTATYEALVTNDDDIPNKKYVDDTVGAISTTRITDGGAGVAETFVATADATDVINTQVGQTTNWNAVEPFRAAGDATGTVIKGAAARAGNTAGSPIDITAGDGYGSGAGGSIGITAGYSQGSGVGGSISITARDGNANDGGNVTIQAGDNSENATGTGEVRIYSGDGAVSDAGDIKVYAGGHTSGTNPYSAGSVAVKAGNTPATVTSGGDEYAGNITLTAGDASATTSSGALTTHGGRIILRAGDASGNYGVPGDIDLYGADNASAYYGGGVNLTGGRGNLYGGYVRITGGVATYQGGAVEIKGGESLTAGQPGGGVYINGAGGYGTGLPGSVTIRGGEGGLAGKDGGNVAIYGGDAGGSTDDGGDIYVRPGIGGASGVDGVLHLLGGGSSGANPVEVRLHDDAGVTNEYIGLTTPTGIASSVTYTLPVAPAGDGYALVSTTAGVMSWLNLGTGLDNSKITDGDAGTAETYIDTDENTDEINSQIGATAPYAEFEPFRSAADSSGTQIKSASANSGSNGGRQIRLTAGSANGNSFGGPIALYAGNGGSSGGLGGDVVLQSGSPGPGNFASGTISIRTPSNTNNYSGSIRLQIGATNLQGPGGVASKLEMYGQKVTLSGGDGKATNNDGAWIRIEGGDADGSGTAGNLELYAGSSATGTAGIVLIKAGDSATPGYIELDTADTALPVVVRFQEASSQGTNYIGLRAPTNVTTSQEYILPETNISTGNVMTVTAGTPNTMTWSTPAAIAAAGIGLGDLSDVVDTAPNTSATPSIFVGDGSDKETQTLVPGTNISGVHSAGGDTYTLNVDDAFIANQGGDTFGDVTLGTWTIAASSFLVAATGAMIRVTDAPSASTDVVNKAYADSIAAGLDPKESVYTATDPGEDLTGGSWTGVYSSSGGPQNSGAFTLVDLTVAIGGVVANTLNTRVLVKNQSDAKQNGIYYVTATGTNGTLVRATDQDGSPAGEVSSGNFTFVEQGNNANSGWVLTGSGVLTLNVNNLNWTQFTGAGAFTTGIGLDQSGNTIFMDVNDLTPASIATGDFLPFEDISETPSGTDSGTRKITVANFISDAKILTTAGAAGGNLGGTDGVLFDSANNNVELDITNLSDIAVTTSDELVFADASVAGTHIKRAVSDFVNDVDIVHLGAFSSAGFITRTADDTYGEVTLGPSTDNDELGINVVNGSGTANVTIGLDVISLGALGAAPATDDELFVYDLSVTTNKRMTVANLATAIQGATNIGDLADVNANSTADAAGNILVADGTDSYDTQKVQHIETVAAQTSVVVSHNLGQQYVIVQCYDTTGASPVMVIPQSVTLTDANTTTVGFSPAFTGKIVIMGIPGVV